MLSKTHYHIFGGRGSEDFYVVKVRASVLDPKGYWNGRIEERPVTNDGKDFSIAPTLCFSRRDSETTFALIHRRNQDFDAFLLNAPPVMPPYPYLYLD